MKGSLTDTLADGISVFDAETEEDLDRVVAVGRCIADPVLWCGSGGLARALARGHNVRTSRRLKKPVLGLFGSDHPATAARLSACQVHRAELSGAREEIRAIERRLAETGVAHVSPGLSAGVSRDAAARWIGDILGSVASSLPPPEPSLSPAVKPSNSCAACSARSRCSQPPRSRPACRDP